MRFTQVILGAILGAASAAALGPVAAPDSLDARDALPEADFDGFDGLDSELEARDLEADDDPEARWGHGGGGGGPDQCPNHYNGFKKMCRCPRGQEYNWTKKKCSYPKPQRPRCKKGEEAYCARSIYDWCKYDEDDDRCRASDENKLFCAKPRELKRVLREVCPPTRPVCRSPLKWNWKKWRCECPKGKVLHRGKCVWEPLDRPRCKRGETAYCASNWKKFTVYQKWNKLCADNGKNVVFCVDSTRVKPEKWCEDNYDKNPRLRENDGDDGDDGN